jgi:hypothetical protein
VENCGGFQPSASPSLSGFQPLTPPGGMSLIEVIILISRKIVNMLDFKGRFMLSFARLRMT